MHDKWIIEYHTSADEGRMRGNVPSSTEHAQPMMGGEHQQIIGDILESGQEKCPTVLGRPLPGMTC